ncbi:MAG: type II toxin-antitoxin system Phd/YefM family antitoxin [Woronichinia naegeliana WA131]|uniref:Type II toxin-antitoxin system Phd/YefM family antitoxin n=1 Tax=Woronichinia naegeliana WA131 TaxID=2824559 RepID=A0A977L4J5_9CYAN|nr:MAG: type II toxin-antitoxin system Phd/YefM family antitoxin [Woronichinia naegeliana WA131]
MAQINLSELPENLQSFLNQAQTTGEILTITQNGIPYATISPIKKSKRATFGAMKNTGKIVGDIVEPTANLITWDALE